MDSEPKDIEAIFHAALEKQSTEEQAAYIEQACRGNPDIKERVEALLKSHKQAGGFLENPPTVDSTLNSSPVTEGPGTKIGRYKLLQLIGEGGFGLVYMAEQERPIRRMVALKIIKLGMDTRQVIARFEAERQALAMMEHPNIARVFDAGATDTGRPYFVMELVKGISITEYCDKNSLSTPERLKLFIDVCKAVQHAHQKGIIHRDIKSSNVMVTLHDGKPIPKIIDFGIAKATQHRLTEKTLFTEYKQLIGTPEYMSPEQAEMSGLDVDTRTDIYSLGVLLYELLTGTTPLEAEKLRQAGYNEMCRIIREVDPPKPSMRLSTLGDTLTEIARHRKAEPDKLRSLFDGDLDWIVMKTLEKDRTRRYATANEFAMDIERHLSDEPVVAGPPSAMYRIKKFIRRHRTKVMAAAIVAAAIVAGLVVSTTLYFQAEQARKKEAISRSLADAARQNEAAAREKAEKAQQEAEKQQMIAEKERDKVKEQNEANRRLLYSSFISLADQEYKNKNIRRVRELLKDCPENLRGWEWYYLWRISDHSYKTISKGFHVNEQCVCFGHDGQFIAGNGSRGITIFNMSSGKEKVCSIANLHLHMHALAFCHKTNRIAIGDRSGNIIVWDAESCSEIFRIKGHKREVLSIHFSTDGNSIISTSYDLAAKVWDANNGSEIITLHNPKDGILWATFSPDGNSVASSGYSRGLPAVKIWNVLTGEEKFIIKTNSMNEKTPVAFTPDGKKIAVIDGVRVKLVDAKTGSELRDIYGKSKEITHVTFGPEGKLLATVHMDSTIKLWDVETGRELNTLLGHKDQITAVCFQGKETLISYCMLDKSLKLWNIYNTIFKNESIDRSHPEVTFIKSHRLPSSRVFFSPNGKYIITGEDYRIHGARIWNMESNFEAKTIGITDTEVRSSDKAKSMGINCSRFTPDGRFIITAGPYLNTSIVWDALTGEKVKIFDHKDGHPGHIVFSPDGKSAASIFTILRKVSPGSREFPQIVMDGKTYTYTRCVRIWDFKSGKTILDIPQDKVGSMIGFISFHPDGRSIATVNPNEGVKFWDIDSGRELECFDENNMNPSTICFSPDGNYLAIADESIRIWDLPEKSPLKTLTGHRERVTSVTYSPDGKRLVSSSRRGIIKIWDLESGCELMNLDATVNTQIDDTWAYKYAFIDSIAFSPDGKCIAAGCLDSTVKVWKAADPEEVSAEQKIEVR